MSNKNNVIAIVVAVIIIIVGVSIYNSSKSEAPAMTGEENANISGNANTSGSTGGAGSTGGTGSTGITAGGNPEFVFRDFTLRMGQATVVDGVKITPLAVEQDSRCAQGTQCVSAGTVRVSTKFEFNNFATTKSFVSGNEMTVDGVTGTIISVSPEKVSGKEIKQAEYTFVLRVKTKA